MRRIAWLLVLGACGTPSGAQKDGPTPYDRTPESERRYKEAVARGEVKLGMLKDEVRKAWGEPNRTSRTTYRRKPATCWSYAARYTDIYFDDDGFVVGWQSATG